MASNTDSFEEGLADAKVAFRDFTSFSEPQLKKLQDRFALAEVKDYEKRKWMFERHFQFICPKLAWKLSVPNKQVQFEIEAIAQETINMEKTQTLVPRRPWDIYHSGKVISEDDLIFKIAQSMVTQYIDGNFKYSETLRKIVSKGGQGWIDQKCARVLSYCMFVDSSRDDIPGEEKRSLTHLYKTLPIPFTESESTSTSGSSSLSPSSSNESEANQNEEIQNEPITNFQPLDRRPNIHRIPRSSIWGPLNKLIKDMEAANAAGIPEDSKIEIDSDSEHQGEHIEMELGLGVLEHIEPTKTESALRETSRITLPNKRKAINTETEENQTSSTSTEMTDEPAPGNSCAKKAKLGFSGGRLSDSNNSNSSSSDSEKRDDRAPRKLPKKRKKKPSKVLIESSNNSSDSEPPPNTRFKLMIKRSERENDKFTLLVTETLIDLATALSAKRAEMGLEPFTEPTQKECDAINEDIMERVANDELECFKVSA